MPRAWVYQLGQRFHVGAEELLQPAVVENLAHDGVLAAQLLQHLLAGDVLPRLCLLRLLRYLHLAEEYVAHLLRRRYVELLASQSVYLLLRGVRAFRQQAAHLAECLGVDEYAVHLHLCQHGHQRHLHLFEETRCPLVGEHGFEHVFQAQRYVGILRGVVFHEERGDIAHRFLSATLGAYQLFDVYGLIAKERLSHVVHVVTQLGVEEVVRHHGVPQFAAHLYAVAAEHRYVVLRVLRNLHRVCTLVSLAKQSHHLLRLGEGRGHGDVIRLLFSQCEAQTDKFRVYGSG